MSNKNDELVLNDKKITTFRSKIKYSLSLILSLIAIGGVAILYIKILTVSDFKNQIFQNREGLQNLGKQVKNIEDVSDVKKQLLQSMSDQDQAQSQNIELLQKQIQNINNTIASPTKDIYTELAVVNVQLAIDYLTLAKDVFIFTNNKDKADALVDVAFQKIEMVPTLQIGAVEHHKIESDLAKIQANSSLIRQVISIEKQLNDLTMATTENISDVNKHSGGKIHEYFGAMIEIQDLPKDQKILATQESKQVISINVYKALLGLQNALYTNDETSLESNKKVLVDLVQKYFVQNESATTVITSINSLQLKVLQDTTKDFDEIISKLTAHQTQIINSQSSTKTNTGE